MFEEIKDKNWHFIIDKLLNIQNNITEIEVNGAQDANTPVSMFIKQKGKRIELKGIWNSSDEYSDHIDELIDMLGQDTDSKFLVEGRLRLDTGETARVHIVLPPACDYPQVTIAKKSKSLGSLESLRDSGAFNQKIFNFLKAAIACNMTMILSGPTGAGKTTVLEALTNLFGPTDRIGIVEDSQELKLIDPNVTYLHSTLWKPGMSVNDVATLSWCVQQLNRQRVDKIIIGETRGAEFADFIVAANSGCEGSMTTIHANNPKTALQKMTNFMIIGIPQPMRAANESISQTIDLILQLGFDSKGHNKILKIENVSSTLNNDDSASIATTTLFSYDDKHDTWDFTNYMDDSTRDKFKRYGYDPLTFQKKTIGSRMGIGALNFRGK